MKIFSQRFFLLHWFEYLLLRDSPTIRMPLVRHQFRYLLWVLCIIIGYLNTAHATTDSLKLADYLSANDIDATAATDGLLYKIEQEGKGVFPQPGDYVKLHYTGRLTNGEVFDKSPTEAPFVFQLGYREVIRGWDKGIPFFKVGSKGQLFIPSELGYGRFGAGKRIPPHTDLIFDIEVLEVMDQTTYDAYMVRLEQQERAAYEAHVAEQFRLDKKRVQEYAISNKIKSKRTNSGLSYAIVKKGKGATAAVGDKLRITYTGYLLDDTTFDTNVGKPPFEFELGKGKVIAGWDEGLQYFNKGSEGYLLIPSQLAYGARAIEEEIDGEILRIPPDAVLIFYIKVVDIDTPQ
ncbi:MAG: FKBP-type peptidyl-prolyl cis-trans isomerase [Bacteroidota bacterium]